MICDQILKKTPKNQLQWFKGAASPTFLIKKQIKMSKYVYLTILVWMNKILRRKKVLFSSWWSKSWKLGRAEKYLAHPILHIPIHLSINMLLSLIQFNFKTCSKYVNLIKFQSFYCFVCYMYLFRFMQINNHCEIITIMQLLVLEELLLFSAQGYFSETLVSMHYPNLI